MNTFVKRCVITRDCSYLARVLLAVRIACAEEAVEDDLRVARCLEHLLADAVLDDWHLHFLQHARDSATCTDGGQTWASGAANSGGGTSYVPYLRRPQPVTVAIRPVKSSLSLGMQMGTMCVSNCTGDSSSSSARSLAKVAAS